VALYLRRRDRRPAPSTGSARTDRRAVDRDAAPDAEPAPDPNPDPDAELAAEAEADPGPEAASRAGSDPPFRAEPEAASRTESGRVPDVDRRRAVDRDPARGRAADGSTGGDEPGRAWTTSAVPTGEALLDVAVARGDAYAVGVEGTVLVDDRGGGSAGDGDDGDGGDADGWRVAVPDGVRARSNALRGVAAVDGGGVWVAGDGGTVGRLAPGTGRHVDHSAPDGDTTTVVDVAAVGSAGEETVLLADGSGRVRRGCYRDGTVTWAEPVTPGSGSSVAAVAFADRSTGYLCDTAQRVFETTDGGRSFEAVGPGDVAGTFTDVAASTPGDCAVSADDGVVHRSDGGAWTPERVDEGAVWAVAVADDRAVACGDDGVIHERAADAASWDRTATPATVPLRGVAAGPSRAVAVGSAGTVVERDLDGGGDGES
jgi:hypothetical protein